MNFRTIIALVAIIGLTTQAHAADVLRRTEVIAQAETTTVVAPTAPVVEVKTVETKAVETKSIETPVDSKAVTKAEELRKARVSEEVKTESTIVEKLEGERLSEEQKRAERLFSDKAPKAEAVVTPVAPVAAPAPTVNIEKIEINQPAVVKAEAPVAPVVVAAPVKTEAAPGAVPVVDAATGSVYRFYVGGLLAAPEYNDSRVNTNFGLGGTFGVMIDEDYAVEGSFIYSNFNVTSNRNQSSLYQTFGQSNRSELDQYEVKAAFKWYAFRTLLGTSRLKPYVGATASYIYREYSRNNQNSNNYYGDSYGNYGTNQNRSTTSDAFNLGALGGLDFEVTKTFSIGGFVEYSHPIMSSNSNVNNNQNYNNGGYNSYNLNGNQTRVETWDIYTFGLTAKFSF